MSVMLLSKSRKSWNLPALTAGHAFALLLALSWVWAPSRAVWDAIDASVFYALNGSLSDSRAWQLLWAVANTKRFDIFSALLVMVLYAGYVFSGDRRQITDRISAGVVLSLAAAAAIFTAKNLMDIGRVGPSLALQPSILLTDYVSLFEFKDRSTHSFPGDHAIGSIMITVLLWRSAGRRIGMAMAALSLLFVVPRMVVGAHWLTDGVVGGACVALVFLSWLLATPLHGWLYAKVLRITERSLSWLEHQLSSLALGDNLQTQLLRAPGHAGRGFCMGCADIIPGVSGGTMAFILGIYARLLRAIKSFNLDWLKMLLRLEIRPALASNDLLFLLPLGVGLVSALLFFTRIVPLPYLVIHQTEIVYGLFFGLIVASVVVLFREVKDYRLIDILLAAVGAALGFFIVTLVPVETPTALWFIFLCGFVAISAMLLPGVSGSFILLILGKYAYILNALGEFNLPIILTFICGMIGGLVVFSRVIVWLLEHFSRQTLLIIKGILIGTLWVPIRMPLMISRVWREKCSSSQTKYSPATPPDRR